MHLLIHLSLVSLFVFLRNQVLYLCILIFDDSIGIRTTCPTMVADLSLFNDVIRRDRITINTIITLILFKHYDINSEIVTNENDFASNGAITCNTDQEEYTTPTECAGAGVRSINYDNVICCADIHSSQKLIIYTSQDSSKAICGGDDTCTDATIIPDGDRGADTWCTRQLSCAAIANAVNVYCAAWTLCTTSSIWIFEQIENLYCAGLHSCFLLTVEVVQNIYVTGWKSADAVLIHSGDGVAINTKMVIQVAQPGAVDYESASGDFVAEYSFDN